MEIYTIGYAKKTAREFFESLHRAGIRRLIDVRLKNASQLAGFTKRSDLEYFLREIAGIEYVHRADLAPPTELLKAYKKKEVGWEEYQARFLDCLRERRVEATLDKRLFAVPAVLLCSEPSADQCHRRLVAEYLQSKWGVVKIVHL